MTTVAFVSGGLIGLSFGYFLGAWSFYKYAVRQGWMKP